MSLPLKLKTVLLLFWGTSVVDSVERSDPTVGVETTLEMKRLDRLRGLFTRTVPSFQLAFVL